MANVLVQESSLQGIAAAIREKNGTATTYKPAQMAEAISAIETGGGFYPSLLITAPTGHTITATNGVDTVTLSEISEGQYWGEVTDYGEWTVSGDNTPFTVEFNVTEVAEYTGGGLYISTTLNDNDWEKISAISQAGTGANYWSVGDCKEITLNGPIGDGFSANNLTLCVFILHFNMPTKRLIADNNIIWGGFKTALSGGVDVCLDDDAYGTEPTSGQKRFNMNHTYVTSGSSGTTAGYNGTTCGGWKGTDLRYDILGAVETPPSMYNLKKYTSNVGYDATDAAITSPIPNTLMAALPSDFRAVLRLWKRWVDNTGHKSNNSNNVTECIDAGISILAEFEIFGNPNNYAANYYEKNCQVQCTYYADGNSKVKYRQSRPSSAAQWLQSSQMQYYYGIFITVAASGEEGNSAACSSYALAPAFKT